MRLLHVISGLGVGGAETFLARLAPLLRDDGFEQTVVSLTGQGPLGTQLEAAGLTVVPLNIGNPISGFAEIGKLKTLMQTLKPDVVQGWMYHGDLAAAFAYRLAGRPGRLFWGIRCSNMDLDGYSLQLRLVVRLCAAMSAQPHVVVANSHTGARVHLDMGYEPQRLEVIHNGVDPSVFHSDPAARSAARATLGLPEDAVVAFSVARVDPMKDHENLLAAVGRVPGLRLVLVGAGTENLRKSDGVLALGRRDDVPALLPAGDIIVSSSAFGEGFPNALAEGMASGLVPVATDVGDTAVIVGETGIVVPPRQAAALADGLRTILSMQQPDRAALAAAAEARIRDHFSLSAAARRFAALYRE